MTLDERIETARKLYPQLGGGYREVFLHRLVLDLAAERERLRAALTTIAEDRVPPSEPEHGNRCTHRRTMDEDCKYCVKEFARATLNQETPNDE